MATAKKLAEAMKDVSSVDKDGKNSHFGYAYAKCEDIIDEGRRALAKNGLAFYAKSQDVVGEWVTVERNGKSGTYTEEVLSKGMLKSVYVLTDGEDTIEVTSQTPIVCERGKGVDKCAAAAKTLDRAYALIALLLIPRGITEDVSARGDLGDDREGAPPARRQSVNTSPVLARVGELCRQVGAERACEILGIEDLKTLKTAQEGTLIEAENMLSKAVSEEKAKGKTSALKEKLAPKEREPGEEG